MAKKGYQLPAINSQKGPFPPEPGTEGYIAIRWPSVGDMKLYENDYSDFESKFRKVYKDDNTQQANAVWNFAFSIKEKDWVICPSSVSGFLLIGMVISPYISDFDDVIGLYRAKSETFPHMRRVQWLYSVSKNDAKYSKLNKIGQMAASLSHQFTIDELKSMLSTSTN